MLKKWRRLPYVCFLLVFWAVLRLLGVNMGLGSVASTIFIVGSVLTIVIEFYKSVDVGMRTFQVELAASIFSLIITTVLVKYMWCGEMGFRFVDLIVCFAVLADAWINPVASFGMALRNVQGNIGHDQNDQGS